MCGEPVSERHNHVADVAGRRLVCTCRGCYLLFTPGGAGGSSFRMVPEDSRQLPDFVLEPAQWDALGIPVGLVFFFVQTDPDGATRTLAYYPSPGGATESLLDLRVWGDITAANPDLAGIEPDIRAALIRRRAAADPGADPDAAGAEQRFECYLVPIDACYELVGIVRLHWVGFSGGAEVHRHIDDFFRRLGDLRATAFYRG